MRGSGVALSVLLSVLWPLWDSSLTVETFLLWQTHNPQKFLSFISLVMSTNLMSSFTLRISTIIMESGHTIVADTEVGLHQSLRCWLLFCQLINYDPLGWYQNNQNITRFSPNPLVGLRNCFPSFSFQNVFTDAWTQIFQLFHTNIFSQRFSAFDSMTEAQRSFAASLSPVIFNLQPSADEIQNKIRSPGRTSQLYNLNYHIARLEH